MNRALVELIVRNVRGRLVRGVRLLRQPRYLLAALASAVYFYLVLGRRLLHRTGPGGGAPSFGQSFGRYGEAIQLGLGLGLAVAVTAVWLLASSEAALRLSETEIEFLLPAPLPRRQVILYSLLRRQPGLLTSTLVIFFFRGRGAAGMIGAAGIAGVIGTWALLTLIDLHLKGVSLWKARLREIPPAAALLRRGIALTAGTVWWIALLTALATAWSTVAGGPAPQADPGALVLALAGAVRHGAAGALLAPFLWIAGIAGSASRLAASTLPPLLGLLFLLAVVALHVEWVVRSRTSFEEATLARARRESERKGVSRQERHARGGRHREPFQLAAAGRPEAAIVWKNLMLGGRLRLATIGGLLLAATGVLTIVAALFAAAAAILAVFGFALLAGIPLLAGLLLRNDLRTDLLHTEILRTWPIAGRRLVLAEILAPAIHVLLILLLGCGLLVAGVVGNAMVHGEDRVDLIPAALSGGVSPLLALPVVLASFLLAGMAVALLSITLQNLAVLLLPSWVGLGLTARRGMPAVGGQLLVGLGHLLAMALAALPTLLVLGAVAAGHVFLREPLRLWELPLLATVTALLLGLKTALLLRLAGTAWERLDPSREILGAAERT